MRVNHDPAPPARKPCLRDYKELTTTPTLLPDALVMLVPLPELERRAQEIDITHPHLREETPIRVALERQRRQRLSGALAVSARHSQVA